MKKIVITLISVFLFISLNAQRDTLKKIRFSGFQVDIGPHNYPEFNNMSQQDYQKLVKTDPFVNADLSSYKQENWYVYRSFSGLAGVKFFADINDSRKIKKEVYIGLKYGQEVSSGVYYTRESYDTIGVYTESNTNKKIYNLRKDYRSYNFGISSQKLILPIGFNFCTDKRRILWITYGVEIAPTLNFDYKLRSHYTSNVSDVFIKEGDSLNSGNNYVINNYHFSNSNGNSNETKLSGLGFGLNASLPFCVYLRPSKKIKILKHVNLMASVIPTYMFSRTKYSGPGSMFTMSMAAGIRYNW